MSAPTHWQSDRRLYRLADGRIVEEADVTGSAVLVVGVGGSLPWAEAARLGLLPPPAAPEPDPPPNPAPKQQAAPPADKAQRGPRADKGT